MSTNNRPNNAPVDSKRFGRINAAIFEHAGQDERGEPTPYYRTTFTRTYTDKEGRPKNSSSFSDSDLLKVKELSGWAFHRSQELRGQSRQPQSARGAEEGQVKPDAFDKAQTSGNEKGQGLSR